MTAGEVNEVFRQCGTDKCSHNYGMVYAKVSEDIKSVLEIGLGNGDSVRAWHKLFPQAQILGVDIQDESRNVPSDRFTFIHSDVKELWTRKEKLPSGFDLIVDDGSHQFEDMVAGWNFLHPLCTGLYVLEDVGPHDVGRLTEELHKTCDIVSSIQTNVNKGSRCIVAQFRKVIEW